MDLTLPPGWNKFSNTDGQVIYVNVSTGQFQDPLQWQKPHSPFPLVGPRLQMIAEELYT